MYLSSLGRGTPSGFTKGQNVICHWRSSDLHGKVKRVHLFQSRCLSRAPATRETEAWVPGKQCRPGGGGGTAASRDGAAELGVGAALPARVPANAASVQVATKSNPGQPACTQGCRPAAPGTPGRWLTRAEPVPQLLQLLLLQAQARDAARGRLQPPLQPLHRQGLSPRRPRRPRCSSVRRALGTERTHGQPWDKPRRREAGKWASGRDGLAAPPGPEPASLGDRHRLSTREAEGTRMRMHWQRWPTPFPRGMNEAGFPACPA